MSLSKKRTELWVGLFLFSGLALLGGLILQFGKLSERMHRHYSLTVVFDDASGVIQGSEVRMAGSKIGQVAHLPKLNHAVQVEVEILIVASIQIFAGSRFEIDSATLLGDKLISIHPPADRSQGFIQPGSRLAGKSPTGLNTIQNHAETVALELTKILKQTSVTLIKMDIAVDGIREASQQLGATVAKFNGSLLADQNLARVDRSLENLAVSSAQWKAASQQFEPTLADARETLQAIRKAADRAEKTLKSTDQTLAELKPTFARIPQAVDDFARTSRKAGETLDRMKNGGGLLGALATDHEVALDAKAFIQNLRQHGILFYRNPTPNRGQTTTLEIPQRVSRPHH